MKILKIMMLVVLAQITSVSAYASGHFGPGGSCFLDDDPTKCSASKAREKFNGYICTAYGWSYEVSTSNTHHLKASSFQGFGATTALAQQHATEACWDQSAVEGCYIDSCNLYTPAKEQTLFINSSEGQPSAY